VRPAIRCHIALSLPNVVLFAVQSRSKRRQLYKSSISLAETTLDSPRALIRTLICADLISPVARSTNGLTVFDVGHEKQEAPEVALIDESVRRRHARRPDDLSTRPQWSIEWHTTFAAQNHRYHGDSIAVQNGDILPGCLAAPWMCFGFSVWKRDPYAVDRNRGSTEALRVEYSPDRDTNLRTHLTQHSMVCSRGATNASDASQVNWLCVSAPIL